MFNTNVASDSVSHSVLYNVIPEIKIRYSPGQQCRTLKFYYILPFPYLVFDLSNNRPHRQGKQPIYIETCVVYSL